MANKDINAFFEIIDIEPTENDYEFTVEVQANLPIDPDMGDGSGKYHDIHAALVDHTEEHNLLDEHLHSRWGYENEDNFRSRTDQLTVYGENVDAVVDYIENTVFELWGKMLTDIYKVNMTREATRPTNVIYPRITQIRVN